MSPESIAEIERVLTEMWSGYSSKPENMFLSLDEAASMGIDIRNAPAGSVCHLSSDGATFMVIDDE